MYFKTIIKRHTFDNQISISWWHSSKTTRREKKRTAQPKRFRLKVQLLISNSLFFPFRKHKNIYFINSPSYFSFVVSFCTVYQFSLKETLRWFCCRLKSLNSSFFISLSPLISYSRLFYPLVRLIPCYLPLPLSFVFRLILNSHTWLYWHTFTQTHHMYVHSHMHTLTRMWTCNNQKLKKKLSAIFGLNSESKWI